MFSTKEIQATVVQAVESLKTEKNDILKRKASTLVESTLGPPIVNRLCRKTSTMTLPG
jgi:hypothetical protein